MDETVIGKVARPALVRADDQPAIDTGCPRREAAGVVYGSVVAAVVEKAVL